MKKLLISINKGGVGKTTLVSQLGRYANQLGLRTLLIDLDDQGVDLHLKLIQFV